MAFAVLVIFAGALGAPALAGESGARGVEMCPVMPDEPVDPNYWVEYQGRTVRFCCRKCKAKFLSDPASYVANLPPLEAGPAPDASSAHDHATGHDAPDGRPRLLVILGRTHVIAVHFPIALLLLAAAFELASMRAPWKGLAPMVRPLIGAGAVAAIGAATLGLIHGWEADYRGDLLGYFEWHRALGLAAVAGSVVAWFLVERRRRDSTPSRVRAARFTIVAVGILVGIVGHLGGALVFGPDFLIP